MLRTLAFFGVAAVAYKQLQKSGSLDRFKEDLKRRTDDLRAHVDNQRANYSAPSAATPQPATNGVASGI